MPGWNCMAEIEKGFKKWMSPDHIGKAGRRVKRIRLVTNIIGLVLIFGYALTLAILWKNIPQRVATHFNALGEADAFGSKSSLLLEFLLLIGIFLLLAVIERFPSAWNFPVRMTVENRGRLLLIGAVMLGALKILVVGLFIYAGLSSIFPGSHVWPMYVLIALTVIVIVGGLVCSIKAR